MKVLTLYGLAVLLLVLEQGNYISCEKECKDLGPCPAAYKRFCHHSRNRSYMKKRCRKFCGFCRTNVSLVSCRESKFGCCIDGKTHADGPYDEGCTMKLCYDSNPAYCKRLATRKKCDTRTDSLRKYVKKACPYSCGFCKHQAPRERCENNIGFGCCWDGKAALGPNERGCPPCVDYYPHACSEWGSLDGCRSGSWRVRSKFMERYCPTTCGLCSECSDRSRVHRCERWKRGGLCKMFKNAMKRRCAKTCNLCSKYSRKRKF